MTEKFIARVMKEETVVTEKHIYEYNRYSRKILIDGKEALDLNDEYRESKTIAKAIIETEKDDTAFFDGSMTVKEMERMLMNRMHFGNAESRVIIAALQLAGANFEKPLTSL